MPTLNLLQSDNSLLTSNQWTLLSNVVHSYDEYKLKPISERILKEDGYFQSTKPINEVFIDQFLTLVYEMTEPCLRLNRDLYDLSSKDRSILLRTGADCITCFGGVFIIERCRLTTFQPFLNVLEKNYGKDNLSRTLYSAKFIDPDSAFTKMGILLFVFSNPTCIFSEQTSVESINTNAIWQIQNIYAEVTWKYLLYKYGYYQAIKRFMNLIQCLFAVIETMSHLQNVQLHVNAIESLVEFTELNLILDDINKIDEMIDDS